MTYDRLLTDLRAEAEFSNFHNDLLAQAAEAITELEANLSALNKHFPDVATLQEAYWKASGAWEAAATRNMHAFEMEQHLRLRAERAEASLEAAQARIKRLEAERDAYQLRCDGLDGLLICYRTGSRPTEKTMQKLDRSHDALLALAMVQPLESASD